MRGKIAYNSFGRIFPKVPVPFLVMIFAFNTFMSLDNLLAGYPTPNPQRAIVSEELLQWHNWLQDGSFEQGTAEIQVTEFQALKQAEVHRSPAAARSGDYGYAIVVDSEREYIDCFSSSTF